MMALLKPGKRSTVHALSCRASAQLASGGRLEFSEGAPVPQPAFYGHELGLARARGGRSLGSRRTAQRGQHLDAP